MFVESFQKKYGYRPEWGADNAYMEFALWADAVERAGTFYPPAVIKSYEAGNKTQSTVGDVYFRAADHQLVRPVVIVRGKKPGDMKNPEDFWESSRHRPRRGPDAGAGRVRLQARRLYLSCGNDAAGTSHRRRPRPLCPPARMITWPNFVSQFFNGLASGALLALISSGLTIIYGTLGVLNLAHGAMFMLGGYAGYRRVPGDRLVPHRGHRRLAVPVRGRRDRSSSSSSAISTAARRRTSSWSRSASASCWSSWCGWCFGSLSLTVPPPAWAAGITPLGFMIYPTYRIVVLGIAAVALAVLYFVLYRTRIGMIVRAGIEDAAWSACSASTSTASSCWCSASARWRRASPASSTRRSCR